MANTLSSKDAERRRLKAMVLLEQGWAQAKIARHFGVSRAAVNLWAQAYRRDGPTALKARPRPGAPRKLTERQMQKLEQLLLQGPTRHGYAGELWMLPRVAELIHRRFGVSYDPSGVWHLLHRMGWSCQKPERRARERDEQAIAAWRKHDWPRIKKSSKKR